MVCSQRAYIWPTSPLENAELIFKSIIVFRAARNPMTTRQRGCFRSLKCPCHSGSGVEIIKPICYVPWFIHFSINITPLDTCIILSSYLTYITTDYLLRHKKYEHDLKCLTDSFDTYNFPLAEKLTNWSLVISTPDGCVRSLKTS